ncbi:MAG: NADH-quinone oxidoreductase subunit J [Gammaproteobacteria bacterium]|nr:NADH-quinone oxidoreductase subunit J [Gammaproteobacteria bacterium]MCY3814894.1 NADH-quinone oxidoreductase subunit J [Gammaproteobacteria bacterium]MDE0488415.1 NADH-quinone oxidoreductase subunit J [Gammaproteobacteria bacterium]MXZ28319.1 NADH-quinone oxidoreductase subunit J [Gammaproteobacteria bacterium]MYF59675.1 NADH-quinone oxidoreductase subunit J [Gammaproteobacteria bacterium]
MQQIPEIFPLILFYGWSGMLIAAAVGVITARNPVHSVLLLVLCFVISAAIWLLLRAEFLAVALVLVYVGAVMVLLLFVVMMLDINVERMREGLTRYAPLGVLVGLLLAAQLSSVWWLRRSGLEAAAPADTLVFEEGNTQALGTLLYTEHLYAFEIAGYILLLAIIGAITLTLRRRKGLRVQQVSEQVAVRPESRVRLVRMPVEKDQ